MAQQLYSIVIINWNCGDDLPTCLRALERQTDRGFEVIVVDNGSTDGSVDVVRRDYPWVTVIETGENLGFAEGCNVGIARASGEWIATLNPDTEPDPSWLAELRAIAKQGSSRLGMIQSRIVFRHDESRTNSTGVLVFRNATFVDRAFDKPAHPDEPSDEIFCASAGAALYRRAMLDDVRLPSGYFDKSFFMYFEDVDLGWRCRLAGWSAQYAPKAIVTHKLHASSKRKGDNFVARQCNYNRVRTLLKNASPDLLARALPRFFADIRWSVRQEGRGALYRYADAIRTSLAERPLVQKIAQVSPREIEERWVEHRAPGSSSPRISIIIPSFNYGRFLGDAIESALGQTLSPVEVIVVDDGSQDDSREVARRYPVRLIEQENAGVSAARNRGASEAKGDFLVFLDADDVLEPTYLARCWDALRTAPPNVAYAYTQMRHFGQCESLYESAPFSKQRVLEGNLVHVSALLRRGAFEGAGGFDESAKLGLEDADLWVRLLERGQIGVFVEEPLLRYRQHGQSRNRLSPAEVDALTWRRRVAYPRLYWPDLVRAPKKALAAWRRSG